MSLITLSAAAVFNGTVVSVSEVALLKEKFLAPSFPDWLAELMQTYKLGGVHFTLAEQYDLSGMESEIRWFTPEIMLEEAFDYQPGLTAYPKGFLPVGGCLIGTGDPYFLDLRDSDVTDPPLVRILHDYVGVGDDVFLTDGVELVTRHLSEFFAHAVVEID